MLAKSAVDTPGSVRAGFSPPSSFHPKDELVPQYAECCLVGFAASADQHIRVYLRACQSGQHLEPKYFPKLTLQSIPSNRGLLVSRHDDARPRMRNGRSGVEDVQMGRPAPLPPLKECPDLFAASDSPRARQLAPGFAASRRFHLIALLGTDGNRQTLAPLFPAAIEHGTTGLGGHPRSESVFVLAFPVVWIVRRLAHVSCSNN